jgi:hypothetical protein
LNVIILKLQILYCFVLNYFLSNKSCFYSLIEDENIKQLLHYIVDDPPEDVEEALKYKLVFYTIILYFYTILLSFLDASNVMYFIENFI